MVIVEFVLVVVLLLLHLLTLHLLLVLPPILLSHNVTSPICRVTSTVSSSRVTIWQSAGLVEMEGTDGYRWITQEVQVDEVRGTVIYVEDNST